MKKWFLLAGVLIVLFIGGYFVLSFYAVKFIEPHLQKVMGHGFTLEETKPGITYVSAKGIRYEDPDSKQKFLQIEEIRVYPSLLSLLRKSICIKELTILQPSFFFYRSRDGGVAGPLVMTKTEGGGNEKEISEMKEREKPDEVRPVQVHIDRIRIRRGSLDFEDKKVGEPPAHIKLRDINFEMKEINYPIASVRSPIQLEAKMNGKGQEGSIEIKGWTDAKTMDMETSLKLREIEVKTFEPYYRKRVTAEIESGTMSMDSKITVKQKRIDAPGELDLVNLHIKEGDGMVFWIPAETLVSVLEKKGHEIKVKFRVKGNMENPRFSLEETFLTQVAIAFAQGLGIPIKVIGEEVLRGTLKGEKGTTEGLQSLKELFKKKRRDRDEHP
ncbi:MAG TPA: DUF748 domain-containing protein [Thermodesulfobacteriota bacterium]|nr:DUF748 domain-containing protein [Thermodesulfobacteriota bacterium]